MKESVKKYSLGLDIGTTSIGWAVIDLENKRLIDAGVRIFEKPEDPQSGKSLAEPRRTARSARRRLKRRRQRLNALKSFFIEEKLLSKEKIEEILSPNSKHDPYEIRSRAIKEKISNEELFIALYHIAKRRGYKSNRKSLEEKDNEGSRVLSALSLNSKILENHTTVGAALSTDSKFIDHKRNKRDDYTNSFGRENFIDEIKKIIDIQIDKGLKLDQEAKTKLLFANENDNNFNGIFSQRPFMTSDLIQKMRGSCELEPDETRAPKASYSFELFRLAQNLAHTRVVIDRKTRALTKDEIEKIIEKAKSTKTIKYSHIREVLGYKNDNSFSFPSGAIRGKIKPDDKTNGESNKFDELTFFHSIKSALKNQPNEWNTIKDNPSLINSFGEVLTINKDDLSITTGLRELDVADSVVNDLLKLNPSGFAHLSIKALDKITPHLINGNTYDKAIILAGYEFNQSLSGDKTKLPPLSEQESQQLTNPVVKRAISQTIKVVNAIIRKHGLPTRMGVEAAGDLGKNFSDRNKIKKAQDENANYNEELKERLQSEFGVASPTGLQITKFKLYNQQNGKCMYSGKPLDLNMLFSDQRYGEIDHIIPFSRCGNDGMNNKVLVLTEENQNKGNLTPYEAWGNNTSKWEDFEARVRATFLPFAKKDRLLAKSPPNEEWNIRALNDTRYISKFLRKYFRENLKFTEFDDYKGKQRVIAPTGPITSYLRRVWRVGSKSRGDNNLHHATDAAIIGSVSQGTIQKVSSLNKYYELFYGSDKNEITDKITGEVVKRGDVEQHIADIQPWPNFGEEIRIRTGYYQSPEEIQNEIRGFENYDESFKSHIKPIFTSRMPKRSGKGPSNKDTLRSPKIVEDYENSRGEPVVARKQRIPLASLKLDKYGEFDSPIRQTDPKLYEVLKNRLNEYNNDPIKAFTEPIYKPTKSGEPGNIVRSVKVYDTANAKTGFYVNNGKGFVNNGSMIRVDVYKKENPKGKIEHFFVPVYAHQIPLEKRGEKITKILPAPKGFTDIDETFNKVTSLYPNDYVRFTFGNKIEEGYYVSYGIASGQISLIGHDSSDKKNIKEISPRSAINVERFDISILGDNYNWI